MSEFDLPSPRAHLLKLGHDEFVKQAFPEIDSHAVDPGRKRELMAEIRASHVKHMQDLSLDQYQAGATATAIYPGRGTPMGLMYCALKMNGEAGELAEHVGKAMRDDGFGSLKPALTDARKLLLLKECGDVLWYVSQVAAELGESLSFVAFMNRDKLAKRKEAGTLAGSGDDR